MRLAVVPLSQPIVLYQKELTGRGPKEHSCRVRRGPVEYTHLYISHHSRNIQQDTDRTCIP